MSRVGSFEQWIPWTETLNGKRFLIHDRDLLFTSQFQSMLNSVGVRVRQAAATITESECHAERLAEFDQRTVPRPFDTVWREFNPAGGSRVRSALSPRAKSSRARQSIDPFQPGFAKPRIPFVAGNGSAAC
jgi:hypothetical protein